MSASLVGSEMCIRDRVWGKWRQGNPQRRAQGGEGCPLCRCSPQRISAGCGQGPSKVFAPLHSATAWAIAGSEAR
eukprot:3848759-Alexandrium_andersonii.AAC.1